MVIVKKILIGPSGGNGGGSGITINGINSAPGEDHYEVIDDDNNNNNNDDGDNEKPDTSSSKASAKKKRYKKELSYCGQHIECVSFYT